MKLMLLLAIGLLSVTTTSWADDNSTVDKYPSISEIPLQLSAFLNRENFKEQYIAQTLQIIRHNAADKMALTQEDIQKITSQQEEQQKRQQMQRLLPYDKNFDGQVTKEEVQEELNKQAKLIPTQIEQSINQIMQADINKDGIITTEEMATLPAKSLSGRAYRSSRHSGVENYLKLDPNGDGKLTVDELKILAIKAFNTVDTDGNEIISKEEIDAASDTFRTQQEMAQISTSECDFPKPNENDQIVFISAYEGKAVSNISVAGQVSETDVIPVQIDKGDKPLYIVASSFSPVIWQLQGSTDRISKIIIAGRSMPPGTDNNDSGSDKINAGVVGVKKDVVEFRHARTCGLNSTYQDDDRTQSRTIALLEKFIGRKPDSYYAEYGVLGLHIFGNRINNDISETIKTSQQQPPEGFDSTMWAQHIQFMPGGLISFKKRRCHL